jgi:pimeloyl-ACP methyl ester carboxylesterase
MLSIHAEAKDPVGRSGAVFVHGIFGGQDSWGNLLDYLRKDPIVERHYDLAYFSYDSKTVQWHPLRKIPNLGEIADELKTALDNAPKWDRLVLIGHSQGGLVIQRYIADALTSGNAKRLRSLRMVIQFATPNTGSELFLSVRSKLGRFLFWRHPQEKTLRPFDETIEQTRRVIANQALYADQIGDSSHPIVFKAFAGETDAIVTTSSARWLFPDTGTLEGDHFSIVKPSSGDAPVCKELVRALRKARSAIDPDRLRISTQIVDPHDSTALEAVLKLQGGAFLPSARVRRTELVQWLERYEERWQIRLSVITANVGSEVVGFLMFHEASDLIVADYIAIGRASRAAAPDGWPRPALRRLLLPRLLSRLKERATHLDVPIVFEVEDPAALSDKKAQHRARSRIRLFCQLGARVVHGLSFLSPDMDKVPLSETESRYLLMIARPGRAAEAVTRSQLTHIVQFLYLKWYRNWFADAYDLDKLEEYLRRLSDQVCASIPDSSRLLDRLEGDADE